jgi:hypothetical protein
MLLSVMHNHAHGGEPAKRKGGDQWTDKVYGVKGLVPPGETAVLKDLITSVLAPTSWRTSGGGKGDVSFTGDKMTVKQTEAVQKNVSALIDALRKLPSVRSPAARRAPQTPQIVIGTQLSYQKRTLQIAVYPVTDVLLPRGVDLDTFAMDVMDRVQPSTWIDYGGDADIVPFKYRGALVVSNTQQAQKEILAGLTSLRKPKRR